MFSYFGFVGKPTDPPATRASDDDPPKSTNNNDDLAPMFPAQNSIQRASGASQPVFTFSSPDDEDEEHEEREPEDDDEDDECLALPTTTRQKPVVPRKKVRIQPGFSQLDWAMLKASGKNLRGENVTNLRRITRTELAEHNTKSDAWSCFHGKVYNMTAYLNFHPGGPRELMRVAGKDGTDLFMKTHAWISVEAMLDSCLVGFLVNG